MADPAADSPADLHATHLGESGPRVVFCHGLFGQGRNWTTAAKALAGDHRVTLLDMPNLGRSGWTEHLDYVEMADAVGAHLVDEGADADDPVALVGHSMGGKIAMLLALRRPELVERLCVVDMSPVSYGGRSEFVGYVAALQGIDLGALERRSDADEALTAEVGSPTIRGFLLQNLRSDSSAPDGWRWAPNLELLGAELDTLGGWPLDGDDAAAGEAPPAYEGPVLWIKGETSPYVTDDYQPAMDRWFPANRRVTIKNAGHWVHSEQPEVFAEVLRRFLARADRA